MAKIMVIDDDPDFTDAVSVVLEKEGYEVVTLDETDGAIERIQEEKPDGLLLDVMFPEDASAGFNLARKIRETEAIARLPIVLLTAVNTRFPLGFGPDDIDETWMPVQEFVEKPVDFNYLLEKLKNVLS